VRLELNARGVRVLAQAEAEALSDVSEKHDVPSVPFFLLFKARHAETVAHGRLSLADLANNTHSACVR
jgi:hypothetical protein